MDARVAVGVDVGSTSTKVVLVRVDDDGVHELRHAIAPTPAEVPDLVAVVAAACRSVLDGDPVDAIGVASMAETGAPIDAAGEPLTPLLRWDAGHGGPGATRLTSQAAEIFAASGVRVSAKTPLAIWDSLRTDRPETFAAMATWLSTADLVVHALTGDRVTDHTLAGRTGGYRLAEPGAAPPDRFDPELLDLVGLSPDRLPRVAAPTGAAARVSTAAAGVVGLAPGTPVVLAGHDHQVAAWAVGAREPGQLADSLGTAEAVLGVLATRPDPERVRRAGMSLVRTVAGEHDALVAGSASAGAMLAHWLRRVPADRHEEVLAEAARDVTAHPEPTGAAVPPYLRGRQSPSPDPRATAGEPPSGWPWPRQARAVVEGICYQARWMIGEQASIGAMSPRRVAVIGGDRLPRLWLDLKRATLPWPVSLTLAAEPVATGAAVLALARSGVWGDPREALRTAPTLAQQTLAPPGWDWHGDAAAAFVRRVG